MYFRPYQRVKSYFHFVVRHFIVNILLKALFEILRRTCLQSYRIAVYHHKTRFDTVFVFSCNKRTTLLLFAKPFYVISVLPFKVVAIHFPYSRIESVTNCNIGQLVFSAESFHCRIVNAFGYFFESFIIAIAVHYR